jgi:hypothetical protein
MTRSKNAPAASAHRVARSTTTSARTADLPQADGDTTAAIVARTMILRERAMLPSVRAVAPLGIIPAGRFAGSAARLNWWLI